MGPLDLKINKEEEEEKSNYFTRNYKNKSIGKELVPLVKPVVDSIGSAYTDTMRDARRGLLGPHSFVGAHAINLAGKVIPDIPIDKGIKHALHEWGGIDPYLSGVAGQGAEIALTRKALKKVSNLKPKDLGITTKIEKINTLPRGKKMWNITKDVKEIFQAPSSYLRKATKLYKHHEGGISWKQAMEIAKRNDLQMNIGYGNEIVNKGVGMSYLPNPSEDTLLDIHKDLQTSVPVFNNKVYSGSTLIPNYQPKLVKPRAVYRGRATTIEGIKGEASAVQFEGAKKEGLEWGKERTPLWKPKGTENVRTGTKLLKGYRAHHEAPLSPSASIKAGLTDEARQDADIYMLQNGMPQGDLVENVDIVPHDLHMPILHKFLDSRLGKKDLNKLVEKHYPGKQIWELELWERKPIFDDYIKTVKESREIIYKFYSALSAYDIPKGATIETVMKSALKLDNEKLELLVFEMLDSPEKLDFASDFFGSINPKAELKPAPKGRLESLLNTQENLSDLSTLLETDRGLEKLLDRMGVYSDGKGGVILGKQLTAAEVNKKYNVPKNDNILQKQLELSLQQIETNPDLKQLIIERTPVNRRLEPIKDVLNRLFPD